MSRKGGITEQSSLPFINYPDSVFIQDDQFLPEYSQDLPLQYLTQEQPRLHSPFQYRTFASPPSSAPSSPASQASSISHFPTTAASADYAAVFDGSSGFEAPSMTPASSYNPSIHVQHTDSPQPQSYLQYPQQPFVYDNTQMLAQQYLHNSNNWENNLQLASPAHAHNVPRTSHQYNAHNQHLQTPSSSSGRSPGNSFQQRSIHNSAPSKPLPTPVHTPVQASFLTPQYQKNDLSAHDAGFSGQFMADQHQHQSSEHSHAPSVSTVSHNSPVTPQTGFEDIEDTKTAPNDYSVPSGLPLGIPKLTRTVTDAFQDELYNPASMQTPQVPKQQHQQTLIPPSYQNIVANRLHAAEQGHLSARTQSPVGSINRDRSPFRQNSPLAAEYEHEAFRQPTITSAPTSQPGMGMQQQAPVQSNTISPKDAVLSDFNEGEDHGLQMSYQPDFNLGDSMLRQDNSFPSAPSFPAMDAFTQFNQAPAPSQPFFPNQNQPQQSRRESQQHNSLLHHTPEFPASLPRFDSTQSEVYHDLTSPTLSKTAVPVQRPQNTSADSGTYTCTYHGCTQRFESPAKLQKHKREAHRQTTPGGHMVGRDGPSRNSQAGPHKCDRINPSTGKPCGSIFSRPYDLTRHEDTIHNARKQKVRCHLCTEEKTFSRNDALTRHMRVVHPEVDWPGKQRRRGGRE
ncbi:hypothetical protein BDV12DRAFT_184894 [Aspergillus spectabilis]